MRKYPPDAGDVLEALRRWLNRERSANYMVVAKPDEKNRTTKDIDYVLEDSQVKPPTLAVEVSSVWRSEEAGGEDAFFAKWFERVQARAQGRLGGVFHIGMPVRVPEGLDPSRFADSLVALIDREKATLTVLGRRGQGLLEDVQGVRVQITMVPVVGSSIEYARFAPDLSLFPERVKNMLSEKAPKLRRYKDQGMETWIVAYNTAWTVMTPQGTAKTVASLLGPEHAHVDHVAICICDPPDAAWIIPVP